MSRCEPDSLVDELARRAIGAAIEVHTRLGPGFLENAYESALALEMAARGIPFERQKVIRIAYKGQEIGEARLDFLVGGRLVLELKAVEALAPIHYAQVTSYLKATGLQLALLINFNVPLLKEGLRRIILS